MSPSCSDCLQNIPSFSEGRVGVIRINKVSRQSPGRLSFSSSWSFSLGKDLCSLILDAVKDTLPLWYPSD